MNKIDKINEIIDYINDFAEGHGCCECWYSDLEHCKNCKFKEAASLLAEYKLRLYLDKKELL